MSLRIHPLSAEKINQGVHMALHEKPANATHWSLRSMATVAGLSHSSVQRIWQAHGLKPHRVETFKISRDKNFAARVADVVGLYLNPPDKALVLCVDEKSQIQALDRTQPGLPMKKGRAGTMTHDYKRNGTTTLVYPCEFSTSFMPEMARGHHRCRLRRSPCATDDQSSDCNFAASVLASPS